MKRLFTLLLFSISLFTLFAQSNSRMNVVETLYYDRNVYIASDDERSKLNNLIEQMKADSTLKINIIGYGDRWGGKKVNDRFSYVRAMYIADWMRSCRVPREQITFVGEGIDTLAVSDKEARRVDVLREIEVIQPKEEIADQVQSDVMAETEETIVSTTETQQESAATQQETEPTPEPISEEIISQSLNKETKNSFKWQHFNLRTNLLYWAVGMMNIGTEYKNPDSNFGFVLNGGYSFFGDTDWNRNLGGWFVAPEVRYYLPHNQQWFVGAQLLAAGYNVKLSDTVHQGTVVGGGVVGGYKLTLTNSFDMDFTLGVGYGHFKYDTYYHDDATSTNPYIEKGITKNSIMPIQAGVNLIWKIK